MLILPCAERVRHCLGPAMQPAEQDAAAVSDEQLAGLNEAKGLIRGALKASQGQGEPGAC